MHQNAVIIPLFNMQGFILADRKEIESDYTIQHQTTWTRPAQELYDNHAAMQVSFNFKERT